MKFRTSSRPDCFESSDVPCSQKHFPDRISTSLHMSFRPIISATLTGRSPSGRRSLMLRTVLTTMVCCDCRPVRKSIGAGCSLERAISIAAARAAAVFPIPVGAAARWWPLLRSASRDSWIISIWPGRGSLCARKGNSLGVT